MIEYQIALHGFASVSTGRARWWSSPCRSTGWTAAILQSCQLPCLEPWCGITDSVGFAGDISERYLNHRLAPGNKFEFTYWIELY